ncbi:hypothetical protein KSP35_20305 [Aquihabitans sp. G128]|uniref:hypothetical protein n=1 Tax=Aquihabitans sp. G128 TaxID=2849779 RepID=UPI001C24AE27|nr:hypothetical protein [Aquihabitans sp. G128]QXC60636.1 hypothetical protein KSP35_20305 [Aquihabitans sp. G128]
MLAADTSRPAVSTSTPTSTSSTTSTTIAPEPTLYAPPPGEPEADLKSAAARFLETLTTFGPGGAQEASSRARLAGAGYDPSLAMQAPLLLAGAEESVGEIVYPQLGGLTGDQASVMAVLRLRRRTSSGTTETVVRTVDVRLERSGDWKVTGVASDGGTAPLAARPDGLAAEVLQSPRLEMSDSARWDVAAGRIDQRILQLVLDLSATKSLSITVFASGHPTNVFGESSVSNHTQGRGVDIWAVDGKPVAGSQPDGPAHEVAASALAAGATELGAPWDLDGPGGPSFTNALHADHLHIAYDS